MLHICSELHKNMEEQSYQNIIFDLGGVIINLDMDRTFRQFAELGGITVEEMLAKTYDAYDAFEKGKLSENEFRDSIRHALNLSIDDEAFDRAWNQMILDLPSERLRKLEDLSTKHRLFLLSNTNSIHIYRVNEILSAVNGKNDIAEYFERVHYSHLMRKRKPDPSIYKEVIEVNNLNIKKTLFIDDTYQNVEAAENLGIRAYHVTKEKGMMDFFNHI